MSTLIKTHKYAAILVALSFPILANFTLGQGEKDAAADNATKNEIVIKDFSFSPKILTVKPGDKITWINRDEEPHTVVSVEKQFKKSNALDTDEQFTITAGAPGTYTYFCSVHPKMTGTIIVQKS